MPKLRVVLGEMKKKERKCYVPACTYAGLRTYPYHEEKHTDVSIAITMIEDTHRASYDKMILVTADTDLLPAVRLAKHIRPQQEIVLCMPALDKKRIFGAKPMAVIADSFTRADAELFVKCQFDENVTDANGVTHTRPAAWREAPATAVQTWRKANSDRWLPNLPNW